MKVLAIETSCDETAASILEKTGDHLTVLANVVSSQTNLHETWGGVVPNLAAREHLENIVPVLEQTLKLARLKPHNLDLLAVTRGPGLIPALHVGVTAAKTLSFLWQKPLIGVNHMEGHIYANLLGDKLQVTDFKFPLLALVVSGGHTELVLMRDHFHYEILGETEDDAAGEAFDKVARMLGIPYPGGPQIAERADEFRNRHSDPPAGGEESRNHQPKAHEIPRQARNDKRGLFPRPMFDSGDYNFSFSGLKTAVLYYLKKNEAKIQEEDFIARACHEFQEAVVDVLVHKTMLAIEQYQPLTFVIAGGVAANLRLRERLQKLLSENFPETQFLTPPFRYSLDNAAMIGAAALYRFERMSEQEKEELQMNAFMLDARANLPL